MRAKAAGFAIIAVGLMTFFLPLVRVQTAMLGTQRISGWDAVKPSDKNARGDSQGLIDSLEKLQRDILRQKIKEAPLAVRQAKSLAVTLPLAYVALLAGGALLVMKKTRALQITAAIGVVASVWSVVSVFWLSSGVKEVVAGAGGSRVPLPGRVTQSMAEKTSVSPELGLYLLACATAALLAVSFFSNRK